MRWHAYWFERNWATEQSRLAAAPLPEDPVFVLGLWRSGTTVLHELLAAATGWVTPKTWQCFNPSTCFLTAAPLKERAVERPMDQGRIGTHGPQEDEFALLLLGEPSLYRGFIDPRRLIECGGELLSGAMAPLERWEAFIRGVAAGATTRLLLKSPNHIFRLPQLRARFPRAQFIWISRHSGEVLASNLQMWRTMTDRYGLWPVPSGALETFIEAAVRASTRTLEQCIAGMPPERLRWVDFESLRVNPRTVLGEVLEFLGARGEGAIPDAALDAAIKRVPIHAGSRSGLPDDAYVREHEAVRAAARRHFTGAAARGAGQ